MYPRAGLTTDPHPFGPYAPNTLGAQRRASVADGPEVNIIRRETINRFADRQDNTKPENVQNLPSLAANMTHDPAGVGPITQPLRIFPTTPEDMSMSGREREVLQSFCILSRSVMERVFHYQQAADCVCPDRARHPLAGFEYSEKVFNYIREAVYMRMCKEGKI